MLVVVFITGVILCDKSDNEEAYFEGILIFWVINVLYQLNVLYHLNTMLMPL